MGQAVSHDLIRWMEFFFCGETARLLQVPTPLPGRGVSCQQIPLVQRFDRLSSVFLWYPLCTNHVLFSSLNPPWPKGVERTGPEPPLLGSLSSQTPSCCPLPDLKIHLMHPSLPVVALLPFQPLSLLLPLRRRRLGLCRLPLLILAHVQVL